MSDVQILTPREAADLAFEGYSELRDTIREQAHNAFGDEVRPVRAALLDVVFLLDRWEIEMLARFGVGSPAGPVRPELVDSDSPRGSVGQVGRGAQNAAKHATRWAS